MKSLYEDLKYFLLCHFIIVIIGNDEQLVQTQIRLRSDQCLHCLPVRRITDLKTSKILYASKYPYKFQTSHQTFRNSSYFSLFEKRHISPQCVIIQDFTNIIIILFYNYHLLLSLCARHVFYDNILQLL